MVRRYVGNGVWEDVPGTTPTPQVEPRAQDLDVALEEVATRFLAHLPESELQTADRLFFQIEQAHWFYEDFLADAPGATLPHFHLRAFAAKLFERVPLLKPFKKGYEQAFADFRAYKGKIPVCGLILLDPTLTKVCLVCNWAKTSWGLPKGKLNQHESKVACAVREVYEETGYQVDAATLDENAGLEVTNADQHACMFCVPDVDPAYAFEPRVRKEISQVRFFPLDELPSKQWNVEKFVPKIKRWAKQFRKKRARRERREELLNATADDEAETVAEEAETVATAPPSAAAPDVFPPVPPEPDSDEEAYELWLSQGPVAEDDDDDDDESYVESDNPYDGEENPWTPAKPLKFDVDEIMREPNAIIDRAIDRAKAREAIEDARHKLAVDAALAKALRDISEASSAYTAGALAEETEALAEEVSYADLEGAMREMEALFGDVATGDIQLTPEEEQAAREALAEAEGEAAPATDS